MGRIIVAFAHNASREKIGALVEQCGHDLCGSFRSGAETVRAVHKMGVTVVVCGFKLADMPADELVEDLEGMAHVLVAASPMNLEMVHNPDAHRIASPISRSEFRNTIEELLALGVPRPQPVQPPSHGPQRTPEEMALINHAKALLIARGMTEAQAHSALQQRSMRNRCKLTVTAQQIIEAYEINAQN